VIVPFEPVGNRPVDPRDTTGQTDPANVGALFAVTVVQEGERQAATAFGLFLHPTQSGAKPSKELTTVLQTLGSSRPS